MHKFCLFKTNLNTLESCVAFNSKIIEIRLEDNTRAIRLETYALCPRNESFSSIIVVNDFTHLFHVFICWFDRLLHDGEGKDNMVPGSSWVWKPRAKPPFRRLFSSSVGEESQETRRED